VASLEHDDGVMRTLDILQRHRSAVIAVSAAVPLAVCLVIVPFRTDIANTNAALGLVLVIVAAAATGIRPAGIVAAVSSAVWFDFFLTQPYERFTITDRTDIETAVLLVLVGIAVTEIALWGRRQQAQASREEGYLSGVVRMAGLVAAGRSSPEVLIEQVAGQLVDILDADVCRFDVEPTARSLPRLEPDGTVTQEGYRVDVARHGMPVDSEIELLLQHAGTYRGRFLITAATHVARPTRTQRQVAVTLADQLAAALPAQADYR
jgi:K+-sensing histidine kinase KdpD